MKIILNLLVACFLVFSFSAFAKNPDCTYPGAWPASMAVTYMENAAIIASDTLEYPKTKIVRISSEKFGKDSITHEALYRQVHHITFVKKSGETIEVITVNDASHVECSMSEVDVYMISKHLGGAVQKQK
jgi:hypothetical protein